MLGMTNPKSVVQNQCNSHKHNFKKFEHFWATWPRLFQVVPSIVSLTSSLRDQLVKSLTTLLPNTHIFFVEKMREAFALQKLLTFFQQKILAYLRH